MLLKIISGGQTGVDQGALDFAIEKNIPCGGWCPKGRLAENGQIPLKYPLVEIDQPSYKLRTKKNVIESDGTLIVVKGKNFGDGTRLTIRVCEKYGKPFLFIDLKDIESKLEQIKKEIVEWMNLAKIGVLNVAGPRESEVKGIQAETVNLLNYLFN